MCFLSVYKLKWTLFSKLINTLKAIINHTDSQTLNGYRQPYHLKK